MPINKESTKMFLVSGDGQKIMLPDEISELEIEPVAEVPQFDGGEIAFDMSDDMVQTFRCLMYEAHGICTLEQFQQNNWRRLHRLPMRRRRNEGRKCVNTVLAGMMRLGNVKHRSGARTKRG